jgi:catechol 2,3-dioxygenase-like lactoylglutathione lyase family enzyme
VAVELNHHIVRVRDADASARFLTDLLGLDEPTHFGPFTVVRVANGVSLDFVGTDDERSLVSNHYAFLVTEPEFDEILERVKGRGLEIWADPGQQQPGEINDRDGGRGFYWEDPDGHLLEILTRPYGSGAGGTDR